MFAVVVVALGIASAAISIRDPSRRLAAAGIVVRVPTPATSLGTIFAGILLFAAARPGLFAGLRTAAALLEERTSRHAAALLGFPLVATVLLVPVALGQAAAALIETVAAGATSGEGIDATRNDRAGPPALIAECLRRIPPDGRCLLAGSRPRDLRGFLLAYYLYPRPLYMLPEDQKEMFFGHRMAKIRSEDAGMASLPAWRPPTKQEYRAFIVEKRIGWVVLNLTDRAEEARLVPAEEAFR